MGEKKCQSHSLDEVQSVSGRAWLVHTFSTMPFTVLLVFMIKALAAAQKLPELGSEYGSAEELMAEYFDWRVDTFPLAASEKGVHKNDLYLRDLDDSLRLFCISVICHLP